MLGKYVLVAKLATGGMAEILLARMRGAAGFEKLVVLKRLLPHLADEHHHVEMFLDEARIAARISHPNVCQVFELGEERGRYVIIMEYLEGVTLGRVAKRLEDKRSPFDLRLVAGITRQACEGLHHAHELAAPDGTRVGLVHRDISPQNLFVTVDGVVKVLDFGIAKTEASSVKTRTGTIKGKTAYMSPEQVRAEPLDRRSDVFSLGVVLLEAVTGQNPFRRENDFLTYKAITEEKSMDPLRLQPAMPRAVADVLRRALSHDRSGRQATARALADQLEQAIAPLGRPLTSAEIAAWMNVQFGTEVRSRRARVAEAIAQQERSEAAPVVDDDTEGLPTVPTDAAEPTALAEEPRSGVTQDSEIDETLPPHSPGLRMASEGTALLGEAQLRPRRTWWLAAAAAAAAIAGGIVMLSMTTTTESTTGASTATSPFTSPSTSTSTTSAANANANANAAPDPQSAPPDPQPATPVPAPVPDPPSVPTSRDPAPEPPKTSRKPAAPSRRKPSRASRTVQSGPPGSFTVDSRPYATITVDGRRIGITPILRHPLPPGTYTVKATLPDGRSQSFRLVIEPGKEAPRRRLRW